MAAKQIFNFGGVKFAYNGTSVTFSGGMGTISYDPKFKYKKRNINWNWRYKPAGFDVEITIKQLYNIDDEDWESHLILQSYLTYLIGGADRTITLYPRYNEDEDDEDNVSYEVMLDGSYAPSDITNFKYGQVLNLSFFVPEIQDSIPSVFSDLDVDNYSDESDNTYVDDSANTYTDGGV